MDEEWLNDDNSEQTRRRSSHIRSCSVTGCTSKGYRLLIEGERVQYFPYPLYDADLCNRWVQICQPTPDLPLDKSFVCSKHFRAVDYKVRSGKDEKKSLRRGAVPSAEPVVVSGPPKATPIKKKKMASLTNGSEGWFYGDADNEIQYTEEDPSVYDVDTDISNEEVKEIDPPSPPRRKGRNVAVKRTARSIVKRESDSSFNFLENCQKVELLHTIKEVRNLLAKHNKNKYTGYGEFIAEKLASYTPHAASIIITKVNSIFQAADLSAQNAAKHAKRNRILILGKDGPREADGLSLLKINVMEGDWSHLHNKKPQRKRKKGPYEVNDPLAPSNHDRKSRILMDSLGLVEKNASGGIHEPECKIEMYDTKEDVKPKNLLAEEGHVAEGPIGDYSSERNQKMIVEEVIVETPEQTSRINAEGLTSTGDMQSQKIAEVVEVRAFEESSRINSGLIGENTEGGTLSEKEVKEVIIRDPDVSEKTQTVDEIGDDSRGTLLVENSHPPGESG